MPISTIYILTALLFPFISLNTDSDSLKVHNGDPYDTLFVKADSLLNEPNQQALSYLYEILNKSTYEENQEAQAKSHFYIANYFNLIQEPDSSFSHYEKAIELAYLQEDEKLLADLLSESSILYFEMANYQAALKLAKEAEVLLLKNEEEIELAHLYSLMCDIYHFMGKNDLGLNNCLKALTIAESKGIDLVIINGYNTLGGISMQLQSYPKSVEYFTLAYKKALETKNEYAIATSLSNIGDSFLEQTLIDSALSYYLKALKVDESVGDSIAMTYSYFNIGMAHRMSSEFDSAEYYLLISKKLSEKQLDKEINTSILLELGNLYADKQAYDVAIQYLKQSISIAQKIDAAPILRDCYNSLAKFYDQVGDAQNALIYFKLYTLQMEKIYYSESANRIAEAQAVYNLEKKEKEIALLKKDLELIELNEKKRKLTLTAFLASAMGLLIIGVIVYKGRIEKKRSLGKIKSQEKAIDLQEREIKEVNTQLKEKNEELLNGLDYARRIQNALLPSNDALQEFFGESFVYYQPREIVSGDYYHCSEVNGKKILAAIDCTGHGVPGAFMTIMAHTLLDQIINENEMIDPASIANTLHEKLLANISHGSSLPNRMDGLDLAIIVFDENKSSIDYCSIKIPVYIVKNGELIQLKDYRYSIGGDSYLRNKVETQRYSLNKHEKIYLATDGFQDQFGGSGNKKFMKSSFKELLLEASTMPIGKQHRHFQSTFETWRGKEEQTDDVLIIGISV